MIPQCPISFVNNTQQDIINPICFIEEVWKPITEKAVPDVVEGAYLVSNTGKVYSNFRHCLLMPTPTWNGYYRVCLRLNNKTSRYYLIHRIVMITHFCIDEYENLQINHKDGDKSYNCFTNLEWTTGSENIKHAFRTGLKQQYHGEECSYATITNEQADMIGYMLVNNPDLTYKQIADQIGCSESVVADISQGQNWKEIYDKYNLKNYKRREVNPLSDEKIHMICKFYEDNHISNFINLTDLVRHAAEFVGETCDKAFLSTGYRLYHKTTRLDIVCKYNY